MKNESKQEFYAQCGAILGIDHEWSEPVKRRNRWNTRKIGNGRFPGFGLVQSFNAKLFRVVSRHGTQMFYSPEEVYEYLRKVTASA